MPEAPAILRVTNTGKAASLTENWHFDSAFFPNPPPIAILAAQQIPPLGGDTMWSNQYLAHDALTPAMQTLLAPLRAAFTGTMADESGRRREVVTYHPVVRTHPVTGRRALGVGRIESVPHIEGMTPAESRGCSSSSTSTPRVPTSCTGTGGVPATWSCGTTVACCTTPCTTTATRPD